MRRFFSIHFTGGTLVVLALVLAGCSGSYSTVKEKGVAYAISREQAKEIVDSAILANISPDYVNPSPASALSSSGYIRSITDTTTITAIAVPEKGVGADGKVKEGYGIQVNHWGTIFFPATPKRVYDFAVERAEKAGEVIRVK